MFSRTVSHFVRNEVYGSKTIWKICNRLSSTARRPEIAEASTLTDIGTRSIFSEEHDIFRKSVRRFFQEEVLPHHSNLYAKKIRDVSSDLDNLIYHCLCVYAEKIGDIATIVTSFREFYVLSGFYKRWEKEGQVSREVWEKAGAQGLLGVNTPAEVGGVGGDKLSTAITWEEQMYVNCSGPGFGLHSDIVMPYITHYGSREQVEKFIPRMTAGKCIGAIAMTEPGAGSDLQGIRTNAKQNGSDWILNGSKVFITNGWMCDVVIVVAITNPVAKSMAHGISLFLVETGTPGFKKGRKLEKIGFKAQDTAELYFDDVHLPASALLGEANKGFYYLMQELPQERLIIADMAQASTEWMFEETRQYVRQRKAFGKTLSNLQTIQHKLAEIKTEVCIGRAFVDTCLDIHNKKGLDSHMASMAKYWCSDQQNKIATQCLQMHGGWGYMWEYPIARAFVDARVQPIYGGSNEIMKELIARKIVADK